MSDAAQIELIRGLTVGIPSFFGAIGSGVAAYFSYRASKHAKVAAEQSIKTEENTNHLKDELVAEVRRTGSLTADAAYQTGKQDQRDQTIKGI